MGQDPLDRTVPEGSFEPRSEPLTLHELPEFRFEVIDSVFDTFLVCSHVEITVRPGAVTFLDHSGHAIDFIW